MSFAQSAHMQCGLAWHGSYSFDGVGMRASAAANQGIALLRSYIEEHLMPIHYGCNPPSRRFPWPSKAPEAAVEHGKIRRSQGYSFPMIVEESRYPATRKAWSRNERIARRHPDFVLHADRRTRGLGQAEALSMARGGRHSQRRLPVRYVPDRRGDFLRSPFTTHRAQTHLPR